MVAAPLNNQFKMESKYSILIRWNEDEKEFMGTSQEFPGLSVFAETREKTLREAESVLNDFISIFVEDGDDLPEPNIFKRSI